MVTAEEENKRRVYILTRNIEGALKDLGNAKRNLLTEAPRKNLATLGKMRQRKYETLTAVSEHFDTLLQETKQDMRHLEKVKNKLAAERVDHRVKLLKAMRDQVGLGNVVELCESFDHLAKEGLGKMECWKDYEAAQLDECDFSQLCGGVVAQGLNEGLEHRLNLRRASTLFTGETTFCICDEIHLSPIALHPKAPSHSPPSHSCPTPNTQHHPKKPSPFPHHLSLPASPLKIRPEP